jgi:hypothetical protein
MYVTELVLILLFFTYDEVRFTKKDADGNSIFGDRIK